MPKLFVIRHAQVCIVPSLPSHQWELSEEGAISARKIALQTDWEDASIIYHSPERKAMQTAAAIGIEKTLVLREEEDLRELEMNSGFLKKEDFQSKVGEYLMGKGDHDFEEYWSAQERIVNCVKNLVDRHKGSSLAIVSHGRILTAFYSFLLRRRLGVQEWQSIKMPDISVIDLETWMVIDGFLKE
ncbi:histidine phosphatase family protein [Falsibacillus albus]|uniref:Histidine phosphatase family protein n=1 Tax=Falsibacillus albus TaxID=2478915 RepID=A0A3L7JSS1_9BACI|nr:histidine phosphatase family protein [Falsibacillus albus]RLQ93315.1 histidine phosphatase family protein [Falsibacillus albus]